MLALFVEHFGEEVVAVASVAAHGVLQQRYRLRVPAVRLAADAIGVFAPNVKDVRRTGDSPNASAWRRLVSAAISASPAPSIDGRRAEEELVDKARESPTASKIWAPQYD